MYINDRASKKNRTQLTQKSVGWLLWEEVRDVMRQEMGAQDMQQCSTSLRNNHVYTAVCLITVT